MRFSQHFGLNKQQCQLDFVDITPGKDIGLYVDPYALSIPDDPWFNDVSDYVRSFFRALVDAIHNNDKTRALDVLSNLGEPEDVFFGMAKKNANGKEGRGIGKEKAEALYKKFTNSQAIVSGNLAELAELDLVVEGISSDNISDMTIAIIRQQLIIYTQSQCNLWGIPMISQPTGAYWSLVHEDWVSSMADLPKIGDNRILLIPKVAVRRKMLIDPKQFHQKNYLDYIQKEQLREGKGFIKLLAKGRQKLVPPTKDSLKKKSEFSISKERLASFINQHPEEIEKYKRSKDSNLEFINDNQIEKLRFRGKSTDYQKIIDELNDISPGKKDANRYHNWCLGALTAIFHPRLRRPVKEQELEGGSKRIDIKFDKADMTGFFKDLQQRHQIKSPYIFVECKNYTDDIDNPALDQMSGRFSERLGKFGIITCRDIKDEEKIYAKLRNYHSNNRGTILVLTDTDIIKMLISRKKNSPIEIDDHLRDIFDRINFMA